MLDRILILNDFASVNGGASQVAIAQACALAEAGFEVEYFAGVGPVDARLTASDVKVHCLEQFDILNDPRRARSAVRGIWNASAAKALRGFLKDRSSSSTIVHLHGWVKCLSPSIFGEIRRAGLASVVTLHDYFSVCPNGGFFDYRTGHICRRRAMGAACVLADCDARSRPQKVWRVARQAVTTGVAGIPKTQEHVIYVSRLSRQVLEPYFDPRTQWHRVRNPVTVTRQSRARAEDNHAFLFVGRMAPEKGSLLFAAAAANARAPARAIGDGADREELQRRWPEIELLGWLRPNAVLDELRRARALVFPSLWYETQGLVVQEALASGIPVIVGGATAASESVQQRQNGLLFDQGDVDSLAEAIRILARDSDLVAAMSKHAYDGYWSNPPDHAAHVRELLSTYTTILQQRRSRLGHGHETASTPKFLLI